MREQVTILVPKALFLSLNDRHGHWAPSAEATQALRLLGKHAARRAGLGTHQTTHVAAFIGYLRAGKADPSNAAPTVKALIDGMVDAGVWPDDDHTHVIGPTYLRGPKSTEKDKYVIRLVLTDQEVPW